VSALRILVVEDNALNLRLVRDILELRGHTVRTAGDVAEARQQLAGQPPSLVLMDIQIPGGGGELLLREIRSSAGLAALPVIAVTAQAMDGDRQRLLAAGFDGYLSKPIDVRTFAATVEGFARP
jgi:two-component system cell cycle response regulator DivK